MLALVGVVPAAVVGSLSFSVNRAEVERTVASAQARVAEEAARACERFVAQAAESLRLSATILPLRDLSGDELASVLRIPYRQLEFVDAVWIPGGPAVYETGNGRPVPELEILEREAPVRLAVQVGCAVGAPFAARDGSMRLPIALRLAGDRILAAELSLAQLGRQMRQTSQGGTFAYVATRGGTVLAQPYHVELSADERDLLSGGAAARVIVRADGERWLASAAPVGTVGWMVVVAQRPEMAPRPAPRRARLAGRRNGARAEQSDHRHHRHRGAASQGARGNSPRRAAPHPAGAGAQDLQHRRQPANVRRSVAHAAGASLSPPLLGARRPRSLRTANARAGDRARHRDQELRCAGRSGADAGGDRAHRAERDPGDAGRRKAQGHAQRRERRCAEALRDRHGQGNPQGDARPDLRPVLHDQGGPGGSRARALHLAQHRGSPPRQASRR